MYMRFILLLILPLLIVGCTQPQAQIEYGVKYDAKVVDVVDGDTIVVQFQGKTETLRILGVDTPEISKENTPYEYKTNNLECVKEWGYKAKDFTYSMLKGKDVQIEFDEKAGLKDSFGRLLAYIYIDGKDFGKMLVEKGYARVYVEGEFSKEREYIKAEEKAFNSDVGVWSCRKVIQTPTPTLIQTVTVVPEEIKEYIVENYGDGKCITKDTGDKLGLACLTDNLAKPLPLGYTKDDICSEEVLKWTYDNVGWCIETTPPPATEKIRHQTIIVITTITPTPLPTTTLTPTPTQVPIPEIKIEYIHFNAPGDDRYNLNGEYVVIKNYDDEPVNLKGWKLRDEYGHTYVFPSVTIPSGGTIKIYTGSGIDTETELYWGSDYPIWNNDGDTAYLYDSHGRLVDTYSYSGFS